MNITDQQLARWISNQRCGRCTDPRRRALLEKIPGWTWADTHEDKWEIGFKQLQKHGMVSQDYITEDGYGLGIWLKTQRDKCNDPERRKRLESIPGWTWNARNDKWEKGFILLQKHGVVSKIFKTKDGFPLGTWIHFNRSKCNDPERRKRLESIPGWFWKIDEDEKQQRAKAARAKSQARRR